MRVVLDTNVIVSAVLIRGGNEGRILRAWQRGAFDLVLSPAILEEIGRVLSYDKIRARRWMTDEEIATLLESLAQDSILVPGQIAVAVGRDPADAPFLAAAVEGRADYLVTGDRDLLEIRAYRGVRLIRPGAFVRLLAGTPRHRAP
jgi:hypothetical protein